MLFNIKLNNKNNRRTININTNKFTTSLGEDNINLHFKKSITKWSHNEDTNFVTEIIMFFHFSKVIWTKLVFAIHSDKA